MKAMWRAILAKRLWQAIIAASVIVGLVASGVAIFQFVGSFKAPPSFSGTWTGTLQGTFSNDHFVLHLTEHDNAVTGTGTDTLKVIVPCPQKTLSDGCIEHTAQAIVAVQVLRSPVQSNEVDLFATSRAAPAEVLCELFFALEPNAGHSLMAGTLTSDCNQASDADIILRRGT
ncbi:MAG TPA: hypothetical protein VGP82_17155 [Ktedonobacterales bacterium]|jgi:hypothetical protein|nr:hypothetical protein [Ktedonobacterales bacterium]